MDRQIESHPGKKETMINGQFFKNELRKRELSMKSLAAQLGMKHHSQLSLTFSGQRRMQLDEAIKLSSILSIPFIKVVANAGFSDIMTERKRLPLAGVMRGTGEVEDVPGQAEGTVGSSGESDIDFAVQARTTDTNLMWMDRWLFFCQRKCDPSEIVDGQFCYLKIVDGPTAMATIRRGYRNGSYSLSGPYTAEDAKLEWAAPVVLTRSSSC